MSRTNKQQVAKAREIPVPMHLVHGHLRIKGYGSVQDWARRHGHYPQYVQLALRGWRTSPYAKRIVAQVREELGL